MAAHAHSEQKHPTKADLIRTIILLGILMGVTVGASYIHIPGAWGSFAANLILMVVAIVKACLVIWFFMGVKYSTRLTKVYVVMGFAVFLLMYLWFIDYSTRRYEPVRGWEPEKPSAMPRYRGPADVKTNEITPPAKP